MLANFITQTASERIVDDSRTMVRVRESDTVLWSRLIWSTRQDYYGFKVFWQYFTIFYVMNKLAVPAYVQLEFRPMKNRKIALFPSHDGVIYGKVFLKVSTGSARCP